jgi:hypothetical protein
MMDLYWNRVQACLVEFHRYAPSEAKAAAIDRRRVFTHPDDGFEPDEECLEHIEPFFLACDIAHNKLKVEDYASEYKKLIADTRRDQQGLKPEGKPIEGLKSLQKLETGRISRRDASGLKREARKSTASKAAPQTKGRKAAKRSGRKPS